ncbi:hypothetical protein [Isoalcanivorax beigongshangi]|uniref:DUF3293 domain-containing protein n=1 Tax=Isoalcanivorax beigongshangi TaxID=3238810 RepID=A0ABV4AGM1_9GAMM
MSYPLMVLLPPSERRPATDPSWHQRMAAVQDGGEPVPALAALLARLRRLYPPIAGPHFDAGIAAMLCAAQEEERLTDYCVDSDAAVLGFAWSCAEAARQRLCALAADHGLVVFDPGAEPARLYWPPVDSGNSDAKAH